MAIDTSMYANLRGPDFGQALERGLSIANLVQQNRAQAQKLEADKNAAMIDKAFKQIDITERLLSGVKDQQTYDNAKLQAQKFGLDVSQLPDTYDPTLVDHYRAMTMSAKERLNYELQQRQVNVQERDSETKRIEALAKRAESKEKGTDKAQKARNLEVKQAGVVVQDLGRALNLLSSSDASAGPIAGQTARIPGTPAWELNQMLDSVKANIAFDKLQAMRAASPTGGALGSVSNVEMDLLQASAGKLDPRLPKEILVDNIKRLYNQYNDVIHGPGNGPQRFELSFDEFGRPIGTDEQKNSWIWGTPAHATEKKTFKTKEIEWID